MSSSADTYYEDDPVPQQRCGEVHSIAEVLEELLTQYQVRFPGIHVIVVQTPATTAV